MNMKTYLLGRSLRQVLNTSTHEDSLRGDEGGVPTGESESHHGFGCMLNGRMGPFETTRRNKNISV